MDWRSINFSFDYLASTGTSFSVEQRLACQSSLALLKNDNNFKSILFWGKIQGIDRDYLVVCGLGNDYLKNRTYFYSYDGGLNWIVLPNPDKFTLDLGVACKGRFIGDPTADSETEIPPNDQDEIEEDDQWEFIKEEERLSAVVTAIQNEAMILPRGTLMKAPDGLVLPNKTFEGLSKEEAGQFTSYYHIRRPKNPWDKNIVVRADYNLTLDFLDSIANDPPLGSWSIQFDPMETLATVRSLYWPGAVCFHKLGSSCSGWFYNGTGKKNWDVPFMILPVEPEQKASIIPEYYLNPEDGTEGAADYANFARQNNFKNDNTYNDNTYAQSRREQDEALY